MILQQSMLHDTLKHDTNKTESFETEFEKYFQIVDFNLITLNWVI